MPRLGIEDLPAPEPTYRITAAPPPTPGPRGPHWRLFESNGFSRGEDRKRLQLCVTSRSPLFSSRAARRLAEKLSGKRAPHTLASSRRFRRYRIRIIGAIWKLIAEGPWDHTRPGQVATISLAPRSWEFTPEQLEYVRGEELLARFRSWLVRAGAGSASGVLIACIHGEWVPTRDIFRVHVHGIATGEMIWFVDQLRKRDDLNPALDENIGLKKNPPRVVLNGKRKPLTDLPHVISYQFKAYWPSRWIGPVGDAGETSRRRRGGRIPEPFHTQLLLWHDRHRLQDITLLMNVRVGKQGLVPTQS